TEPAWEASVSSWVDGEADIRSEELDTPYGRQIWDTYHLIGDVMRSPDLAIQPSDRFYARVSAAIDAEPPIVAPSPLVRRHLMRNGLSGLAVAAAVASVAWMARPFFSPRMRLPRPRSWPRPKSRTPPIRGWPTTWLRTSRWRVPAPCARFPTTGWGRADAGLGADRMPGRAGPGAGLVMGRRHCGRGRPPGLPAPGPVRRAHPGLCRRHGLPAGPHAAGHAPGAPGRRHGRTGAPGSPGRHAPGMPAAERHG